MGRTTATSDAAREGTRVLNPHDLYHFETDAAVEDLRASALVVAFGDTWTPAARSVCWSNTS